MMVADRNAGEFQSGEARQPRFAEGGIDMPQNDVQRFRLRSEITQ